MLLLLLNSSLSSWQALAPLWYFRLLHPRAQSRLCLPRLYRSCRPGAASYLSPSPWSSVIPPLLPAPPSLSSFLADASTLSPPSLLSLAPPPARRRLPLLPSVLQASPPPSLFSHLSNHGVAGSGGGMPWVGASAADEVTRLAICPNRKEVAPRGRPLPSPGVSVP